jgi:hypothetical protein
MADLIPFKEDAQRVTCTPTAAVTGKTLVAISGDRTADGTYSIAPAGDGATVFGVAAWDCAIGALVTVITVTSGQIVPITAGGGAIAAGDSVVPEAGGTIVVAAADVRACGIALTGSAENVDATIQLVAHNTNAA